ncbi:MAG: TonB-dependent receptor [Salinibacter sp.]|uniref:TonB-dependent receptor n=1 Tax=Salinibacter sp. TaxID=2065818 RepID=UPI002FC382B1
MTRLLYACFGFILVGGLLGGLEVASAQSQGEIAGTVLDANTQEALPGANVTVLGTNYGTSTDADGNFRISGLETGRYDVQVSFVGYRSRTRSVTVRAGEPTTLNIRLQQGQVAAEELVVTGSRQSEKVLESPVQVETVTAADLETSGGGTFLSSLSNLKGVDFARVGINGQSVSMRGFNNNFNTRLLQLKDGRLAQLPGTGLPQGNFLPSSELDVKTIEVVVGPASALYGPDAHTGVVNLITKTPWDESGVALDVRGGQEDLIDLNGRVAGTVNDKFGWKVNGQFMSATDYRPPTGGPNASAADSTHFFGPLGEFNEIDLVEDYDVESIRTEGSLYYRFADGWQAEFTAGFSENDNFGVTNNGRNRIKDWQVQFQSLKISSEHWFAQATRTANSAGDTYQINNVAAGAEAIFGEALQNGASPSQARQQALDQLPALREANTFVDEAVLWDSEIQYSNSFRVGTGTLDFVTGGQFRRFLPDSEGTFLADANNEDIDETEGGGYLQLDYRPTDDLRFNAAARVDGNSEHDTQFSPKAAVVYTVAPTHNVRFSFNRAFKSPTTLNNELFITAANLGPVFRGNGGNGFTIRDGPTTDANVVRDVDPLDPEEVNTIELGYKGVFQERLAVNLTAYNSWYENFISPLTNVANPAAAGTFAFEDGQLTPPEADQPNGFLWTYFNFGSATVRGLDVGAEFFASEKLTLSGNFSLIDLSDFDQGNANQDLLLNVPETKVKGSVTVRDVGVDNYFISFSSRWKSSYEFRSGFWDSEKFYDDGEVPSRFTASLTAGYTVPQTGVKLKASVTNLFDEDTPDTLGAPETGRLFWVSATYKFQGLDF